LNSGDESFSKALASEQETVPYLSYYPLSGKYIDILFPKGCNGKSNLNPSIPRFLTILNGCRG